MTTNTGQATTQERIDPMVETLIKGLIETASHPKAVSPTEDAITAVLMATLIPPARTLAQASSFEKAIFAATLAPALAEALAPALAEALVPAIEKALNTIVSQKETSQELPPKEGSEGM